MPTLLAKPNPASGTTDPENGSWLIDLMLEKQSAMTAVERFSSEKESCGIPSQSKFYRDLIPLSKPQSGQQYAFEVDMDSCTGCKSCVAACHSLNGLDSEESFREVGLLQGGPVETPMFQTITSACHHCDEPACADGCPVNAYEKDEVTGIVKHLDDQCIGCQYCILKCPYDVPKYNSSKGIVRKCDMCSDRLAVDEAPACVQACPDQAIKIKIVNRAAILQAAEDNLFLPGAPDPGYTKPSTRYISKKTMPENMQSADHYKAKPEHAHWPLVIMLVLTQMSVGAFVVDQLLGLMVGGEMLRLVRPVHAVAALALGVMALGASTLHLGRPMFAFRAIIGLRTSWLSREIVAFGLFAKMAAAYAAVSWFFPEWHNLRLILGVSVAAAGLLGVACSMMIYHDTRRVFWNITQTGSKFMMTMAVLGLPLALVTSLVAAHTLDGLRLGQMMVEWGLVLCAGMVAASVVKLLFEATIFQHLGDFRHNPMKVTALLMVNQLKSATWRRYIFGFLGGVIFPAAMLMSVSVETGRVAVPPAALWTMAAMALIFSFAGEILERYLFFTAVVSPKMPGGVI